MTTIEGNELLLVLQELRDAEDERLEELKKVLQAPSYEELNNKIDLVLEKIRQRKNK